jgi:hypothetical protein
MPAATALPDVTAAVITYLRAAPAVAALVGTKISARRQAAWGLPAYAVLVEGGRGGAGEWGGLPLQRERFDLTCYGPDDRTAHLLWRTVHYALLPPIGSGRLAGFTAAGTSVVTIEQEGGPLRLVDPETSWPYTVASYQFTYASEPAA